LRQKEVGNIEKARALGKAYAEALLEAAYSPKFGADTSRSQLEFHHQLVLCSYIVGSVIGVRSPDPLLAQTSLQRFYHEVQNASEELYKHISDPAAFSLYILWERSHSHDTGELGRIYARLCGREGDGAVEIAGSELYRQFRAFCEEKIDRAGYAEI
jgi:hypothetical protein